MDTIDRFWSKVNKTEMCWLWTGNRSQGYGKLSVLGESIRAHRYSYILHFGAIPQGMLVCHRCDNPACVRPDHLFLGTSSDNAKDAYHKGRLNILEVSKATQYKKKRTEDISPVLIQPNGLLLEQT